MSTDALLAADAAARHRAQTEFDAPLVIEAGAGSGKTSILVARVVAWALGPGWERSVRRLAERGRAPEADDVARETLSRVVAITFTEAAAAEMAARVGEWLGEIEAGQLPVGVVPEALPPAEVRAERAAPLRAALDRLVVRTIHAWCRRLLAERPLDVGLHPAFEVDADEERSAQIVREVVEQAIPLAYPDRAAPLSRLVVEGHGPRQIEEALLALVLAGARPETLAREPLASAAIADLVARLRAACDGLLGADADPLVELGGPRTRQTLEAVAATRERLDAMPAAPDAGDLAALVESLDALWEKPSRDRLRDWRAGRFSEKPLKALAEPERERIAAVARPLHGRLTHTLKLDPALLALARAALAPLLAEVERRQRAAGVETFAALLRDARRLVSESERAAERIRAGIDQLLVDEFQDTDALQCEIVGRIGLEGQGARPSLFLVGDPRQSIYGWRSADLRAYDDFVARVEAAGGARLRLARNFRSQAAVLDEVKRAVEPCMRPEPGVQPPFQDLVADRGAGGEVEHWVSWGWDGGAGKPDVLRSRAAARLEAEALAADVARRGREEGVAWQSMAILLRGMTDVDVYLDALRDADVPYAVEQDRRYYQRREVIEASALLRAVLDPHDHVALVGWLRSAAVGVPDAAWTPLWARDFPERMSALRGPEPDALDELRALVAEAAAAVDPTLPGMDRIAGWAASLVAAIGTLAELRAAAEREPADRFVERLRTATLIEVTAASRYLGLYRVANLDQFFRDVRDDLEETGGDVSEVLRRVRRAVDQQAAEEEARPRDAADEAVRIMSIHKAKGLDFDHVYLVQLHKGRGGDRAAAARVGRGPEGEEYELFGARTLGFDAADEHQERIEEAERVRTLYVATTRARDRLVLVGKHPVKGDTLQGSHARLLGPRRAAGEAPEARMARLAERGEAAERDGDGVLWRFPGLARESESRRRAPRRAEGVPDGAQALAASRRLVARRAEAAARAARPRAQAASDLSHEAARDRLHARRFPADGDPPPEPGLRAPRDAELAAAVGTAVHAALERWDAGDAPDEALASARRVAANALRGLVGEDALDAAVASADEILARFAASPLAGRLREIDPHVVGRELPVLLPPGADDAALGHLVGAIDLLYRDPDDGAFVVADYKSDDVRSEREIEERAARYAAQGGAYVRAVSEALGLATAPRFELWFLATGARVSVPIRPPPAGP